MRSLLKVTVVTVVAMFFVAVGSASGQSLEGESFSGVVGSSFTSLCPTGENATHFFQASGTAEGPYPGTFQEEGNVVVEGNVVTAFSSTFTITSGSTTVSGAKELGPESVGTGTCVPSFGPLSYSITGLGYSAEIVGPSGIESDEGLASVSGGSGPSAFESAFESTKASLPTSKDECKKGGWQAFGVFKNQGDCVSFVATGGKNPPAG